MRNINFIRLQNFIAFHAPNDKKKRYMINKLKALETEFEELKAREKALGERVLQLQKDKGKLIDENRELRCCGNCARPCYNGSSSSEEYCLRNNRIQWKLAE